LRTGTAPHTFCGFATQRAKLALSRQSVLYELAKILRLVQAIDVTVVKKSLLLGNECAEKLSIASFWSMKSSRAYNRNV